MANMLVNVRIGDNDNKDFTKLVQVELSSIDCLVIKDNMEICSCEEFDKSWDRLVLAIERKTHYDLPSEWYVDTIEGYEYP